MDYQPPIEPALEPIPHTRPVRALYSRAGFCAFAFLCAAQITISVLTYIWYLRYGANDYMNHHLLAIASAMQYIVALPACWLIMRGAPKQPRQNKRLPIKYFLGAFAVAILFAQIGTMIAGSCAQALSNFFRFEIPDPLGQTFDAISLPEVALISGIFAPIFEELFFRKFILDRATAYGEGAAVFLSALLFGLVHSNIYQFFYAFLLGILFGYIYVKTGRLRYTIALHCLFNLANGVLTTFITAHIDHFDPALIPIDPYQAGFLAYLLAFWAFLICGIVLCCVWFKKIKADLSAYTKNLGERFACVMLCGGVITTTIISLLLWLVTVFQ